LRLVAIEVECYAWAKADETPNRFTIQGPAVQIAETLDRWCQVEGKPDWPRADSFKVHADDGRYYLLKHELDSDEWWVSRKKGSEPSRLPKAFAANTFGSHASHTRR
jgi:hypothetical protein